MKRHILFLLLSAILTTSGIAEEVIHPKVGETATSTDGKLKLTLIAKKQNYSAAMKDSYDQDINSPKSASVTPDGKKYYINSLEGGVTIAYDMATHKKLKVISHNFTDAGSKHLWAPASGLFEWHKQWKSPNTFMGKPVEATFSHGGRYLWVPYYRRIFDINAVEPSAMAVIDTQTDEIVRLFETGPLPKMVATSHDNKTLAVTHWGNNTVGLLDISSNNPEDWHYTKLLVVDYVLPLNFGNKKVNRDNNSGYCLRGTVFTPDDKYIIVCCMGGGGGLAVIDVEKQEYLGRVMGVMPNVRHILINDGYIYLSVNSAGYLQRIKLDKFLESVKQMTNKKATLTGWENCKVGNGARTIEMSPSGKYIFAACNNASSLCVVDTRTMKMIAQIPVDSYPVGLDVSKDGKTVIVTSQGHTKNGKTFGGLAVNIYSVEYAEPEPVITPTMPADSDSIAAAKDGKTGTGSSNTLINWFGTTTGKVTSAALAALLIAAIAVPISKKSKKK
ncbi:MAG: beta-propeller fold lactonase family protein [Muribaculaceae bacterium]|nr:beta-propeller fold lactonase family protein [Muribaculaceae bacterium]